MASSTPPICSRLPSYLTEALELDAAQQGLDRSELIRSIINNHFFGGSGQLSGPNEAAQEGYHKGRRLAAMMARIALQRAEQELPDDFDAAMMMIHEEHARRFPSG